MSFYKYTPALIDPKTLEDTLIGRDIELDNLRRILKSASSGRSISHAILIGPKGIGKSHILRILYNAVLGDIATKGLNEFKDKFVPVILSEEEYVGSLMKFIVLILRYLNDANIEDIPPIPKNLITPVTLNDEQKEHAVSYMENFKKSSGKRLLLLIDNLNDIIERFTDEDQSLLREILMTSNSILLVGAAPTLFDSIINHDKPLYNFFEIIWLKELPFEETMSLLNKYAKLDGRNDLVEAFKKNEPKLRAIHELAGGNPRLILSQYHIITEGDISSVETTFLKLLDELTPYFTLRMKDLTPQQSEIVDVIARAEILLTPTEISIRCYMPVAVVNAQLKRLIEIGYVVKSGKKRAKRVLYDLNEKLFRLWRQMRVEAGRKRLGFIVMFLETWFTKEELFKFLDKTLDEIHEKIFNNTEIEYEMDRLWYIKEAINEFKNDDEICVACQRQNYNTALEIIERAQKLNPNDAELFYKEGCVKAKLKNYKEAENAYRKSIDLNRMDHASWYALGGTLFDLGKYDEALEACEKSIELKPDSHSAFYNKGNILLKLKRYREAIDAYQKAIDLKPDAHDAWNNLGFTYGKLERYSEAIDACKKAINIKPNDYNSLNNLGNLYRNLKRYDEAIDIYEHSVKVNPNIYKSMYKLALLYEKNKQYDKALKACDRTIKIEPLSCGPWYLKGHILLFLEKTEEAIKSLRKVLNVEYCESCGEGASNDLSMAYISLFHKYGIKGQVEFAIKNLKESINYLIHIKNKKEVFNSLLFSFRDMVKARKINLIHLSLNEIVQSNMTDLIGLISPYLILVNYLETNDFEIVERLHHEERIVVEDMIKIVEGEEEKKPVKKKKGTGKRKKRDSSLRSE